MALDDFIGVRSTIVDNQDPPVGQQSTRGSVFIFGTAARGPKHTPIQPSSSTDLESTFGEVPLDASFDTSLVRGYYEFKQSCKGAHDVYLVRVGDTTRASLTLFESFASSSTGELSFTPDEDGFPSASLTLTALVDGAEFNGTVVTIGKDGSNKPNHMLIELPDGTSAGFNLSTTVGYAGVISTVADLVARINAHDSLSGKIHASFVPLTKDLDITITNTGASKDLIYKLAPTGDNESWGDKLLSIDSAYVNKTITANVASGLASLRLPVAIQKNMISGSSIDSFCRIADYEAFYTVGLADNGQATVTKNLACKNVAGWDSAYSISGVTADSWAFELYQTPKNGTTAELVTPEVADVTVSSGTATTMVLASVSGLSLGMKVADSESNTTKRVSASATYIKAIDTDTKTVTLSVALTTAAENGDHFTFTAYTVNASAGTITIYQSLKLGTMYSASYRYKVAYAEAKLRSDMLIGDARSYFIFGDTIIFGAAQPAGVIMKYTTKVYFDDTQLVIDSTDTSTFEFVVSSDDLPAVGEKVYLTISYQPELPSYTGASYTNTGGKTVVQKGALTGGIDGTSTSKKDYLDSLVGALAAVDLYPRKKNVFMGVYLDDAEMGPDYETGLAKLKPINMAADLLPYIERASKYTEECTLILPVRPLADLSQSAINTWLDRLINTSSSDATRPANVIEGYTSYRIDVPLGVFMISVPQINNGSSYLMNPACLYAACQADLSYTESMVRQPLPGNIKDLGVKLFNAQIIGDLNAKRYTTAIVDERGRFVWSDAPTLAIRGRSQYDRQYVRDVVYEGVARARTAAEKYLGKPMLTKFLIPMRKDVANAVMQMVQEGAITDAFVDIESVPGGQITGKTKIKLKLSTAREIRNIEIETSVTLGE